MQQHRQLCISACRFVCLFLCEWRLQLTIHIFHSKVDAEFFSERQSASSSTCALWVTVSMSAVCRLVFFPSLHTSLCCFSDWNVYRWPACMYCCLFFPWMLDLSLHVPPCVKSVTILHAGVKAGTYHVDPLPRYVYNFTWFVWFLWPLYAVSHSACACDL